MKQVGPHVGYGSDVFHAANRFFRKRELQGLKAAPGKKVRRGVESKDLDVSGITLEGESEQAVKVYDTCDDVRRKINAFLRKPDVTQAAFCREIAKSFPGDRKVQSKQLNDFLGKKGATAGNTSCVYYGSYVFFEKHRLKEGKAKTQMREEMEKIHPGGMNTTEVMNYVTCFGNERPYTDKYVLRTVAEAGQRFDLIVCANKALDQDASAAQIAPAVDEKRTTIAIIQNGVGNEEPFRKRFPRTTIISCVTWTAATQPEPGQFEQIKSEDLQIGLYPNKYLDSGSEQEKLDRFSALLRQGNTVFNVVPDIQVLRWEKVVWNVAWNSLTTLTQLDTHAWLSSSPGAKLMTHKLMTEVIDVAIACNVPLDHELADRLIDRILSIGPISSSMAMDCQAGREMEVDIILGYPLRKARELGVATPMLEALHTILVAVNHRLKKH
ncbi:hypothetical protein BN1723_015605 [Verticillium longisporum]|uniref:2-dehydropantoate 2-reductase n=1 Tax=Verticillium longisporum TaxID=100787 RepID=A0A0G4N0S1_VERLO|nr:hypothetical protein BN1723_015605 [Verticillium longisporum]